MPRSAPSSFARRRIRLGAAGAALARAGLLLEGRRRDHAAATGGAAGAARRDVMTDDARAGLAGALTFHAGFDRGADADFALGDRAIYTVHPETGALAAGLGDPPLVVAAGRGRFGGAL